MFSKDEIYELARRQSAVDLNCNPDDFRSFENKVVISKSSPAARRYLELPFLCNITSYGSCAVASVGEEKFIEPIRNIMDRVGAAHLFETPALYQLNDYFRQFDAEVCFMAEYFLPDGISAEPVMNYRTKWLYPEDFSGLYLPEWSNAICEKRRELDRVGIGAYDGDKLIGFAGASADCEDMWQIGIDVLPEYRGEGLSTALTVRLKNEIFLNNKVPFYCAAWCNIRSVRNAIASGFRPAWDEVGIKSIDFVKSLAAEQGLL